MNRALETTDPTAGADTESPVISVVVAPTERGSGLPGALAALSAQDGAPRVEVIVPYDARIGGIALLRQSYPGVLFLEVPGTELLAASPDVGVRHQALDRRRAAGLAAARGQIIALTDEYGRPDPAWCARLAALHADLPHAVIGGAIENANDRTINWAVYFGDAGRYQNPLADGPARYVSDVNVSYKRAALYEVEEEWRDRYHETGVHDALMRHGHTLWLTSALVVRHDRGEVPLADAVRERFAWARLYAGRRTAEVSPRARWLLALGATGLGPLLFARQARVTWTRGDHRGKLLRSAALLLALDLVWSAGELIGYVTGRETASPA